MRHLRFNESLRRVLASGCVALILVLGVFAASPALHERLHHSLRSAQDEGCAVVLFASGVPVPLAMIAVPPTPVEWRDQIFFGSTELLLDSLRYLLQPGRGPPAR